MVDAVTCESPGGDAGSDAIATGVFSHGAVDREHKALPTGGLDAAQPIELTDPLQAVDGLLLGLGGKAVHQVDVHRDAGTGQGAACTHRLGQGDALVHELEEPVQGRLEAAGDANASGTHHRSVRAGSAKACSNRMLVNQLKARPRSINARERSASSLGDAA